MSKIKLFVKNQITIASIIRHLLLSWLVAVIIEVLILPRELHNLAGLEGLAQMSFTQVLGLTFGIAALLLLISCIVPTRNIERWCIVAAFASLAILTLSASFSWAFASVCILVLIAFVVFGIRGWNGSPEPKIEPKKSPKLYVWITVGLAVAFFTLVSAWTVARIYIFSCPTYDFGIFAQMFYNMKETGLPLTTLERDGSLSHFAVHVSPIYYLILPFYWLVPYPATLQVLQAAIIASAVIPLWKIGKHHGLSGVQRTLICALLLLYPAFSGGTSYDIHENCFLTPLILWLLYGIDRKNTPITVIAAFLTLLVKEDAAVYVAVIALWLTVKTLLHFKKNKEIKNLITAISLLILSVGYFFIVTGYLAKHGDGVMTYRYENFMYDDSSSLITVIKSIILNPMKAIYECVDSEKLSFIFITLLPLLGLPLLTRRYERYILLIPYILVNLMSDYTYQHSIFFQYTFGSIAFLIYLTVINLADLKIKLKRVTILIVALALSVWCFTSTILPTAIYFPAMAIMKAEKYQEIREVLDSIPNDATVSATTFYTTYLSSREVIYDVEYCTKEHLFESEFIVLGSPKSISYNNYSTYGKNNGYENLIAQLKRWGYSEYATIEDTLVIWHRK